MKRLLCLALVVLSAQSCKEERKIERGSIAEKAMVVSARVEASRIGAEVLQKGGNAFFHCEKGRLRISKSGLVEQKLGKNFRLRFLIG